jgi:hypothetical protein
MAHSSKRHLASTASRRLTFVTIAKRPFGVGRDGGNIKLICLFCKSEYFQAEDLTDFTDLPDRANTLIPHSKSPRRQKTGSHATTGVSTWCAHHDEMIAGIKPTRPYSTNWVAPLSGPREP